MAKKENGRELLRQDNDSLRKQFVDCRKLLEKERANNKELTDAVEFAIQYLSASDIGQVQMVVARLKETII
jgi:hypothetical protein